MNKPNFEDLKKLTKGISDIQGAYTQMYADKQNQEAEIKGLCGHIAANLARQNLTGISVDELKNAKAGIRVSALFDAGYTDFGKIASATDYELARVDGVGEKQVEAIRRIITEFANSLSSKVSIRLDPHSPSQDDSTLITILARYRMCEQVRQAVYASSQELYAFSYKIKNTRIIKNGFRWFFSGSALKQQTLDIAGELYAFYDSELFGKLVRFLDRYHEATALSPSEAISDFNDHSADFYALLESIGASSGNRPFLYDSIPEALAQEIDAAELNLSGFNGNLRAYQAFGAKYIVHQKKVLLGDEMGLGKTVQAIAAMSHIAATEEKPYFLVICPASVLINWDREIKKFSSTESSSVNSENRLKTYILHGAGIDSAFSDWRQNGGAAITNYESMGKIVDGIDNHMRLSMLIVDEAHYMKNPDAKRTMYIRRLDNESERILMMTGTPLENRVEEMCNLIDFVRPDMTDQVRNLAHLSSLPEFRETLSPVYLRRTRQQVLSELPPIDERQEWCSMSEEDKDAYVTAVTSGSFADMRRVSFLQDDIKTSAKATRLIELCDEARDEGRKIVIYSFFRETISRVEALLGNRCAGVITGSTEVEKRQPMIDAFSKSSNGSVLVCQIQAGGVGLNIQAASIVIFCEPQIKPSLTNQALSRVYRMGQVRNVLVYHLLCPDTVDEKMMLILSEKKAEFDNYAADSAVGSAAENIVDSAWIQHVIEEENKKYLPAVLR